MRRNNLITGAAVITLLALLLVCLLPAPAQAFGIGVTSKPIEITDALRGGEYQRTITLFNTGEQQISLTLTAAGEISAWVTFYDPADPNTPIDSVTVPGRPGWR